MDALHYLQTHLPPFWLEIVRLTIWLVLLSVLFVPLERLWAVRRQKILRKAFLTDLSYYFLNSILPGIILAFPLSLIAVTVHRFMPYRWQQLPLELPLWAHLAAVALVAEIGFYWGHRWSHEFPLLWRFHAIHHSAEEIDWLINTRAHPLDMVFTRLCGLAPLYVLGLAQPVGKTTDLAPLILVLAGTVWGFFVHANVRWRFGWLEWLLATPTFHHWHHTRDEHRDHNYAPLFPVLDWLFGTLYMPKEARPARYGTDTPVPTHVAGQLLMPILPGNIASQSVTTSPS